MKTKRVFLIVLDSFGIGYLPDAEKYGDVGSNTLQAIAGNDHFSTPNLTKLGLFNIDEVTAGNPTKQPAGAFGYDDRTLGDRRSDLGSAASHLSGRLSAGADRSLLREDRKKSNL